jgi:hypothetical protein
MSNMYYHMIYGLGFLVMTFTGFVLMLKNTYAPFLVLTFLAGFGIALLGLGIETVAALT